MTVRCVGCNKVNYFRNFRGNKLSNHKCECGGDLQMVGGHRVISGEHPFDKELTNNDSKWYETPYYLAEANKKGEVFVQHNGFFHQIENFVLAAEKSRADSHCI